MNSKKSTHLGWHLRARINCMLNALAMQGRSDTLTASFTETKELIENYSSPNALLQGFV